MKCNWCSRDYTREEIKRQYGTEHFADYGCCSEQCYTNAMTGVPKPPPPPAK